MAAMGLETLGLLTVLNTLAPAGYVVRLVQLVGPVGVEPTTSTRNDETVIPTGFSRLTAPEPLHPRWASPQTRVFLLEPVVIPG